MSTGDSLGAPAAGGGEDGIVGGPRTPQQQAAQRRLQQTQAQVDEVVDIMKTNVEKVLERDQKLSELDDRADALQQGASQFEQQAGRLKRKFWLQNLKMMIIMGLIGLVILAIIVRRDNSQFMLQRIGNIRAAFNPKDRNKASSSVISRHSEDTFNSSSPESEIHARREATKSIWPVLSPTAAAASSTSTDSARITCSTNWLNVESRSFHITPKHHYFSSSSSVY